MYVVLALVALIPGVGHRVEVDEEVLLEEAPEMDLVEDGSKDMGEVVIGSQVDTIGRHEVILETVAHLEVEEVVLHHLEDLMVGEAVDLETGELLLTADLAEKEDLSRMKEVVSMIDDLLRQELVVMMIDELRSLHRSIVVHY